LIDAEQTEGEDNVKASEVTKLTFESLNGHHRYFSGWLLSFGLENLPETALSNQAKCADILAGKFP
jgi:hypothetical protein